MNEAKPKILIIGDAGVPTGYARVLRAIFEPLASKYDLTHLGTRFVGGQHDYPWDVLPASQFGDVYGQEGLPELIDKLKPDIVFLLYDLGHQPGYMNRILEATWRTRTVIYSPIESGPLEPEILLDIVGVSRYVVFTEHGRDVVLNSLASPFIKTGIRFPPIIDVIPHGVDTDVFYPLDGGRVAARQALELDSPEVNDAFIVFNGNRNLVKKHLDVTLEGFAQFAASTHTNVKLLLHTNIDSGGYNIPVLARRLGIGDHLIVSTLIDAGRTVTSEHLNLIYNGCDLGVNSSVNEGWGLVSFEHAATRRAQIVPGNPNLRELWGEAAILLETERPTINPGLLNHAYPVTPETLAAALLHLHNDPERCNQIANAAYAHVTRSDLSWASICHQWDKLLISVLAEPPWEK